ncbi:MAG TPA: protein-disulfide reductase DsbD domain-containing protein [Ignavibacteriaceae bacterium]|nr:protein-disulfide reductase DsbD domain-containing protein [Ignavibacteriaceae bacterium]
MKTVKYIALVISILFLYNPDIFSQSVKPESVVGISSKSTVNKTTNGTEIELKIILNIEDTRHINAHKPTDESLTPTSVKFEKSKDFAITGIKYPPAEMLKLQFSNQELALYETQATVKTKIFVGKNFKEKELTVRGNLRYQPCNNQTCLFPVSKPFSFEIRLK